MGGGGDRESLIFLGKSTKMAGFMILIELSLIRLVIFIINIVFIYSADNSTFLRH